MAATFRVELRSSRRLLRVEKDRVIFNPKNTAELAAVLADMADREGVPVTGHRLIVIDTSKRRWRTVKEISA